LPLLLLITACASNRTVYVSGRSGVQRLRFDPATAALTAIDTTPAGTNPSFLALSAARRAVYVADEDGHVAYAFAIGEDGALSSLGAARETGGGSAFIAVDSTGSYAMVSNYGEGTVRIFPIEHDGALGEPLQTLTAGAKAHAIVQGPIGHVVHVPCLGDDKVVEYGFADGTLSPLGEASVAAGAGPRHIAFHPTRPLTYVLNELDSTLVVFGVAADGTLTSAQAPVSTLPADFTGTNTGAEVQVAPSGRFVYTSNRGRNSIAIFAVDETSGAVTRIGDESTRGVKPRHFSIDASGAWLFVANEETDNITVFAVDQRSGALTHRTTTPVGDDPQFVQMLP
jgi:6-phosphogluconolactonase